MPRSGFVRQGIHSVTVFWPAKVSPGHIGRIIASVGQRNGTAQTGSPFSTSPAIGLRRPGGRTGLRGRPVR